MPEAMTPVRALILYGSPGSGKGTQAKLLKECLHIPHISTGDMLRERMQSSDDLGMMIKKLVDSGELVTDDLVNLMVQERVAQPDCQDGFILDGYPRTLSQAETVCRNMELHGTAWVVVHLKVDYNEIIRRLAGRLSCSVCGAVYNLSSNPPKIAGQCDSCGAVLTVRDDDKESVVRRRLLAYDAKTRPLLEYLSGRGGAFYEVDAGNLAPPVIAQKICELVQGRNGDKPCC